MRSFVISVPHYVQIQKNEMVGICVMNGGEEGCIQDFGGET